MNNSPRERFYDAVKLFCAARGVTVSEFGEAMGYASPGAFMSRLSHPRGILPLGEELERWIEYLRVDPGVAAQLREMAFESRPSFTAAEMRAIRKDDAERIRHLEAQLALLEAKLRRAAKATARD